MECPLCTSSTRRFGRNRNGSQRYRCDTCNHTFTDWLSRPPDQRRLSPKKEIFCLRLLLEDASVRSIERLTNIHRDTILAVMVASGQKCQPFLERAIVGMRVDDVQADEVWGFVGCKEKTRERNNYPQIVGDAYCFTAMERTTKLMLTWHLGKRCPEDTRAFALKLHRATSGRFQLTTDGYRPYLTAIPNEFGHELDYATLVKVYGESPDERRYSPPHVVAIVATPKIGTPDPDRICTSHIERSNLTVRMQVRRMTRLTNAFSKKWENHEAALALFFAYYNFCRVHMTLKCTPAEEAGLTDHAWSVLELLQVVGRL
jgi:transposase-like protein/IS1 family transposase